MGSVVITIDGQQGAGKTTMLYRFMNDFAAKNKCVYKDSKFSTIVYLIVRIGYFEFFRHFKRYLKTI